MKRITIAALGVSGLAFVLAGWAAAQGDQGTIDRIVDIGKHDSHLMKDLGGLCEIGSRLTGSPRLRKAQEWAAGKFRSYGLSNVHLEQWGEWPMGWEREPGTYAKMVRPFDIDMVFTSPDWTNGTNGPLRGAAVADPKTKADFEKVRGKLKDAWVVTEGIPRRPRGGGEPPPVGDEQAQVQKMVEEAGIAGRVYGARGELVITFGNYREKTFDKHPKLRQVILARSDMDRIKRNLDWGKEVVLECNLDYRWWKGPVPQYNVVAEIPGSEKPDEVVIVSGHLDSWDGPGSQGALDNGTGSCTALEAARILVKAHACPKRTIRFILWSGEEEGLLGSHAYVEAHKAEMDKISAVLVDDGGTDYQGGYVGPEVMRPMMEAAFGPSVKAFPEFPQVYKVVSSIRRQESGSDHASFWKYNVPGFFTIETGRSDYNFIHHTQHDRIEYAIPEYLVQSATNHAIVAYNLACADTLVPRQVPATTPAR
ncbi:MAG: M20/M25/M40 family metallo-hydrolase [Fimbriimonas ginsengisoli]|uniref:Carboxypeptidase Q n=1 Tax=Fimbriimonas ginsengisoli TaxID=1005039 RepID=A0A931PSS1_FIMGI|nr:M20/M25/M40 family metallo-hydrolase [Fimbriimonas ginsengisoli]